MNMKQIIGAILMVVQTVLGVVLVVGVAVAININSDSLIKAIHKSNYLENTEIEARETLCHYMDVGQVEEILNNTSVKSEIKELANAMDSNTIDKVAANISISMKEKVVSSIKDDVDAATKESYATVVTNAYMKTIFPTTELGLISGMYTRYKAKVELALIILGLVYAVIYVFLSMGKKTYKWEIVSLYNVMIFASIIAILIGAFNGIVIGNERTTSVILNLINGIRIDIIIGIVIVLLLSILSNYVAYFKRTKKKS